MPAPGRGPFKHKGFTVPDVVCPGQAVLESLGEIAAATVSDVSRYDPIYRWPMARLMLRRDDPIPLDGFSSEGRRGMRLDDEWLGLDILRMTHNYTDESFAPDLRGGEHAIVLLSADWWLMLRDLKTMPMAGRGTVCPRHPGCSLGLIRAALKCRQKRSRPILQKWKMPLRNGFNAI